MSRNLICIAVLLLTFMTLVAHPALAGGDREREVRDAVSSFVAARTAGMEWDVKIRRLTFSAPLKLPAGPLDYEVVAPQQWEGWGNASIAVLVRQNDRVVQNIPLRIDVEALTRMVIAQRQIEQGTLVAAEDLVLQKREITQNSSRSIRKIEEASGKKARGTIRANQPLRADQLEKVALIKSGQLVTIIAENEVMKISVAGKARGSGAEGDLITVQNQNSLKEIPARVINATTVQVAF